ncbi:MAG: exosome complex exonuclease Rrp41, partial [Desulfurococcaceae archaeon]
VGKVDGVLVVDVNEVEDQYGEADLPIGITPNLGEIVLFQLNGVLTRDELRNAVELAFKATEYIYKVAKDALHSKYMKLLEEVKV